MRRSFSACPRTFGRRMGPGTYWKLSLELGTAFQRRKQRFQKMDQNADREACAEVMKLFVNN